MHRIDHATRSEDENGVGKDGFTEGDPVASEAATIVTADILNGIQEEICTVIERSGRILQKGTHDQLSDAIAHRFDTDGQLVFRDGSGDGVNVVGTRFLTSLSATISSGWGRTTTLTDPKITSSVDGGKAAFDLTPLLPRDALIRYVRVHVKPGIARVGGSRLFSQLHRLAFSGYPSTGALALVQQGANVFDDGTALARWQTHDHSAAPLAVNGGNGWFLTVSAGVDGPHANFDEVYGVAVEYETPKLAVA